MVIIVRDNFVFYRETVKDRHTSFYTSQVDDIDKSYLHFYKSKLDVFFISVTASSKKRHNIREASKRREYMNNGDSTRGLRVRKSRKTTDNGVEKEK